MANFMACYRRSISHYADVECTYAEFERYLVLSCNIGREHEDRAVCWSPRGEGSLGAFRRGRNRNHADREFDFDDPVLSDLLKQQSRRRSHA